MDIDYSPIIKITLQCNPCIFVFYVQKECHLHIYIRITKIVIFLQMNYMNSVQSYLQCFSYLRITQKCDVQNISYNFICTNSRFFYRKLTTLPPYHLWWTVDGRGWAVEGGRGITKATISFNNR